MTRTINWHTKVIYSVIALAFMLGMVLVPGTGIVEATGEINGDAQEVEPSLVPDIAFNVKGSIHEVCIDEGDYDLTGAEIDWWLESGVDLSPGDISVMSPNPDTGVKVKGVSDNVTCIEIRSMKRGDIHIFVEIESVSGNWTLQAEKKWGELDHTELDVDAATTAVEHTKTVNFPAGRTAAYNETLEDTVYATFLEVSDPELVDHALVHWWLVEDDEAGANQDWVDDLMDYLAAHDGGLDDDHWAAHGKYMISDLDDKEPWEYINDWVTEAGDPKYVDTNLFSWVAVDVAGEINTHPDTDVWYAWAETSDGTATATLNVDVASLVACTTYNVMIVVLVSYPSGSTPQNDPFNGENIICLEKGKKEFHKGRAPQITEVKTPQLRWAGEKIVLEKDWSDLITVGEYTDYLVEYNLEFGSVGTLHGIGGIISEGLSEGKIFASLDEYDVSLCILESEQAGEADVDAALYYWPQRAGSMKLVGEMGFLVYFLEFEDVTLAEDITPLTGLSNLTPDDDDAEVAVRVRGFFDYQHSHLMATMRPEKYIDLDGNGTPDKILPAGRYVLPDDWWLIAETTNIGLRPNFDLMDQPGDDITSLSELGPYDTDVRTTDPPNMADDPCIGPFNTLQLWSTEDMWISSATVASSLPVDYVRNTVVPDGYIDEWDAPMPQALVIFDVVSATGTLSGLDKGALVGYGIVGTAYQSPFYSVEIPSSPFIPAAGYNWDSWGADEPYEYWTDLGLDSIIANTAEDPADTDDVEVYCDNHGIAAVTIDALVATGTVTITATAEFPYTPKRGKYGPRVSDEIDVYWGQAVEHLNPDFEADPRSGPAPLTVDFENWTGDGTPPYVEAKWDFNNDGTPEIILNDAGTDNAGTTFDETGMVPLDDVEWTFPGPGIYTIALTMTDSTLPDLGPLVHTETKVGYVTVTGSPLGDLNSDGIVDKSEVLSAIAQYFDGNMQKTQVLEIIQNYFASA